MKHTTPSNLRRLPVLALLAGLSSFSQASAVFEARFDNLARQGALDGAYYHAGDTAEQTYSGTAFTSVDQVILDAYFISTATGPDSPLFSVLLNGVSFGTFFGNNTQGGPPTHLQFFGAGPTAYIIDDGTWQLEVVLDNDLGIGNGGVQFLDGGDHVPRMRLVSDELPPGGLPEPSSGALTLTAISLGALGLRRRAPAPANAKP